MKMAIQFCPKCGATTVEMRVRFSGMETIPDVNGPHVKTTCTEGHFIGYKPVDWDKVNKTESAF